MACREKRPQLLGKRVAERSGEGGGGRRNTKFHKRGKKKDRQGVTVKGKESANWCELEKGMGERAKAVCVCVCVYRACVCVCETHTHTGEGDSCLTQP